MILLVGDLHFKKDNVEQAQELMGQVLELLSTRKIHTVVLLGDLLHTHAEVYSPCLVLIVKFVADILTLCDQVVVLVGNHDMVNNQVFCDSKMNWLSVFDKWERVLIAHKPIIVSIGKWTAIAVPYVYPGRFKEALDLNRLDLNQVDFCFAHQEFLGCKMRTICSQIGDDYSWETPCFSGHIHSSHRLGRVLYTGAAFEHTFDSAQCYLWIIESDKSLTKIKSLVSRKVQVSGEIVDGKLICDIVDDATPQLFKCIISTPSTEAYRLWLGSEQGKFMNKHYKLVAQVAHNIIVPQACQQKRLGLVQFFEETIRIRHPDCIEYLD